VTNFKGSFIEDTGGKGVYSTDGWRGTINNLRNVWENKS